MKLLSITIVVFATTFLSFCDSQTKESPAEKNEAVIAQDTLFDFENHAVNTFPAGWQNALTGKGKMCHWQIVDDQGNKVLAQTTAVNEGYRFNMAVNNHLYYKDLELSVRMKGMEGHNDQGGGLVWRYQDENNYYIVRANPLEDNYTLYRVVNGNRKEMKNVDVKVDTGRWYSLKVRMKGNKIQCFLDGKMMMETTDNTFGQAGMIGLWTKSDARSYFDDLRVLNLK